jgi:Cupredoxin-like domain
MRRLAFLIVIAALAIPASAQEWPRAPEYDVLLTSYDIQPEVIRLAAGEPVRLRFVNDSHQRHDFTAPDFFRAARLRGRDAALVQGGSIRVAPLSTRTIALIPRAGRYRVASRDLRQRLLGMQARIIVE